MAESNNPTNAFDDFESIFPKVSETSTDSVVPPKEEKKEEVDMVNHPPHYDSGKFECIDVMLETQGLEMTLGFCICNAFKYLYRHRNKNGLEDVKKALWYILKYIELAEAGGKK